MCRHLAYLGPAIPLRRLLTEAPHSLLHQSYAPTDMRHGGRINADGYGVGWYPDVAADSGDAPAVRYRRGVPMWADANLGTIAATVSSGAILAAVRNATVGMPVLETAAAPFVEGRWLFSHNGAVTGWPESMTKLAERLPTRDLLTLDAPTDAALLWALLRHRLRAGARLPDALAETVADADLAAPGSRLNLLLTDGAQIVATTAGHALSVRRTDSSVLVSSEPLDDDAGWHSVDQGKLVVATRLGVDITDWGTA
ncbi:MAG: gamma-glutamyl hercynylcysteine S-oxide hydrolase [Micromonosporaceae bacterium]|nr:gamma-glutamyl hercynylcysteine S-oxide hydrolase [Micromonosporaceae bacterium]